jgi:hypothetical protein
MSATVGLKSLICFTERMGFENVEKVLGPAA